MQPLRIAIVGLGKIARDQHVPAIAGHPGLRLVATVGFEGSGLDGVPHFASLDALLGSGIAFDTAALCTPPQVRHGIAARLLAHGVHLLLEKPPGATLGEVEHLRALAQESGSTLFAAWHSRFASGVEPARAWLAGRRIDRVRVAWREDVRVWHPGQAWIFEPGGLGVFDPGINALSILTHVLPGPVLLTGATLAVPENLCAPIAGTVQMRGATGAEIAMELDFLQTGPQSWDIVVETDAGTLTLADGGATLKHPGGNWHHEDREYPALYGRFADLIRAGESDVDVAPLRLVADAFLRGRQVPAAAFIE